MSKEWLMLIFTGSISIGRYAIDLWKSKGTCRIIPLHGLGNWDDPPSRTLGPMVIWLLTNRLGYSWSKSSQKKLVDTLVVVLLRTFGCKLVEVLVCENIEMPSKANMTMEHRPFEDVFPIENGEFPASHVSFRECKSTWNPNNLSFWFSKGLVLKSWPSIIWAQRSTQSRILLDIFFSSTNLQTFWTKQLPW